MIPLDRVRELLSLAPGPHGGTLLDTSFVHDLARDVLSLADALATAERERDEARAERDKAKDTAHCAVVEWYAISQERDRNWTRYQRADDERLSTARRLRTAEAARDAALASADLSARAAVDAARELGHVAAAAVGERDTARSALDGLAGAVRAYLDADRDWRRSRYMIAEHINAAAVENTERLSVERDTARSALDGLVAAVRAEREAERGHAAVRADDASRGRHLRAAEAAVDKARHATDAILSAAPAPTTVPAEVVRAYLRADARSATGTHADATALAAARTALDAALERRA